MGRASTPLMRLPPRASRSSTRGAGMTANTIGPYRLLSLIGRGNLGEVWRARDTRNDREVALKLLDGHLAGDVGYARRFRREVAATAGITFPHIVPIHDFG